MIQTKKYGVALLAVGLAVGGFTSRDEWNSGQVEVADRTRPRTSSLVLEKTSRPVRVGSTKYEDESRLAEAIDRGQALRLQLPGRESLDFSFRGFPLLAAGYRTTLGQAGRPEIWHFSRLTCRGDWATNPPAMAKVVATIVMGLVVLALGRGRVCCG